MRGDGPRNLSPGAAGPLLAAIDDGHETHWTDFANCRDIDHDVFFPDVGESAQPAKRVCSGCLVRDECLQDALKREDPFGIWGGTTEKERRPLVRALRAQVAA